VHDVERVTAQLWSEVNEWLLTPSEICLVMEYFGEPIPASTIRRWKMEGKLRARGQRDGKPRYWPGDVRALRNGRRADVAV
jgi:predicted site-specific integrase-resolvase